MNRVYADSHYSTVFVNDTQEGYAGLELHRTRKGKKDLVSKIIYWDASGQFYLETFNTDIPLRIIEDLIAEAKATIKSE